MLLTVGFRPETVPGMFASLFIILPGEYWGGKVQITHGTLSGEIKPSYSSLGHATVMAWHSDVLPIIEDVYENCIALSYNLVYPKNTPRPNPQPSLDMQNYITKKLHAILGSWSQTVYSASKKIVYLLDPQYVDVELGLGFDSLTGANGHKFSLLWPVAKRFGFGIGLAFIKYHVVLNGVPDKHGYDGYWATHPKRILKPSSKSLWLNRVLTWPDDDFIPKIPLDDGDAMEKGNETIPSNLRETLEKGPVDDEDNDAYAERVRGGAPANWFAPLISPQSQYGWKVERSYSRPVLVIWPELREHEVRREEDDLVYNAFLTVEGIRADSTGPTPLEEQSVEFLLDALQASEPGLTFEEVARAICPAASAWKNDNLWIRFFEICRGQSCSEILKAEFIDQGLLELGEDVVLPRSVCRPHEHQPYLIVEPYSLEDLFDHGPGHTDTLEFLDRLEAESEEVPEEWISVQRQRALSGLGSLTADRIVAMIDASESLHSLRAVMTS